jgi:hypothetical protein
MWGRHSCLPSPHVCQRRMAGKNACPTGFYGVGLTGGGVGVFSDGGGSSPVP